MNNLNYINAQLHAKSLSFLYRCTGVFFEFEVFIKSIKNLSILAFVFSMAYLLKRYSKIASYVLIISFFVFIPRLYTYINFSLILLIIFSIYYFIKKKLSNDEIIILLLSFILASKSVFNVQWFSYSNYGFFVVVFCLYILFKKNLDKNWLYVIFCVLLLCCGFYNFLNIRNKDVKLIKTPKGNFYISSQFYNVTKKTIDYIAQNLKENETMLTVPEGQILNLIANKGWGFYNTTFIPLDFEIFGENNLIQKLRENKTDYIVIFPRDTSEYGAAEFCKNYAVDFCSYISDNYKIVNVIGEIYKVYIYKINKKE